MTDEDRKQMMQAVGISDIDELFADIPDSVRYRGSLPIPPAMSEPELLRHMSRLSAQNADLDRYVSFLGAGIYDHHLPAAVHHIISRSEFYTAYTPYQPEISQGELQAIFEFQSYICELTGLAVANASMYDGATALAEAGALAAGATKRNKLVVARTVHPEARRILRTVANGLRLEVVEVGYAGGVTDMDELKAATDRDTAAVIVQSPNFFGCIEDVAAVEPVAHGAGALLVVSCNPLALALLEPPGRLGADIAVGDAQPFGIPASLGGPTCGYFAVAEPWMRRMPGRIVGQTVDRDGKRGFVLTLQAREQHIRREKATSNICSNQALLALAASVYLSIMGKRGIREAAGLNVQKAYYAARALDGRKGMSLTFAAPFFNEFVVSLGGADIGAINRKLLDAGMIGGYDLGRDYPELKGHMLVAVTERRTREEIDRFADRLEELL
jgi:glycine dehydrogenase subunit 1